jgi:hypothetical protein
LVAKGGPQFLALLSIAALFLGLLTINVFVLPYPIDNDLDEIGWIAAHQTWSRPESLVNQGYPFGYPLLLRLLTPLFGSLVTAAFICSTIAATVWTALVYRLTRTVTSAGSGTAIAAAATALVMLLPLAISEYADNVTTALLLAGLLAVVSRPHSSRAIVGLGFCVGLSALLRFHYLLLGLMMPVALLFLRDTLRGRASAVLGFLAGFVVGALPLLALNVWVRGQPLHTGSTPYMIGWLATNTFDWDNFLATYDLWPLPRLVRERPGDLLRLLYYHAQFLLTRPEVRTGIVLVPLALAWVLPRERRRTGMFLAAIMVLYFGAIIVPAQFSFRSIAPVTCLLCVLSFPVLARLSEYLPAALQFGRTAVVRVAWMAVAIVVLFVGINNPLRPLLLKHTDLTWNRAVLDAMNAQGYHVGAPVFCNFYEFYPLDDPRFITFHNYGGYMLLDPLYNATMPRPEARTATDWQAFFDRHHTEFVVARPTPVIQDFIDHRDPAMWPEIRRDERVVVFKRSAAAGAATSSN